MKSIKEAANEYAKDYLFRPLPQRAPNVHFEVGANYVLGEIEKILQKEDKNINDYGKSLVWRIKDTIEQLKK